MLWVEIRPGLRRVGKVRLVPLDEVGRHTGFRSAFAFPEDVAAIIREQNGTHGLSKLPVYCDTVLVDFDRSDGSILGAYLDEHGIGYQRWASGGRSIHYHISVEPILGPHVPAVVKAWVARHAPDADMSTFHHAAMFRLPHTLHAKNAGQRKELLHQQPGELLTIPLGPVMPIPRFHEAIDAERDEAEFFAMLTQAAAPGQRRPFLFKLAVTGLECGMSAEDVREHLYWWSQTFASPPSPAEHIEAQLAGALRFVNRR